VLEVGANVQREAVACDPSADSHANRRHFFFASIGSHPDARAPCEAATLDVKFAERDDQGLFDVTDVAMYIATIGPQVEDWVTDELTRPVVRDVAAAAGLENRHAFRGQNLGRRDDVRVLAAGLDAKRDDWWMLEKQQRVANRTAAPFFDKPCLQLQARAVLDEPQTPNVEAARRRGDRRVRCYTHDSSKFCRRSFSACRNRPASAPSIRRWS
jgi:hypothetical protein